MECIGPIVVLVAVLAQVIGAVRKAQEQARRRAMQMPQAPPPRRIELEEQPADWEEIEELEPAGRRPALPPPPLPRRPTVPPRHAPAVRTPLPPAPVARLKAVVGPQAAGQPAPASQARKALRAGRKELRAAVIWSEILGPPVGMR